MQTKPMIETIRNIDKLIAHEKDRQQLIQRCCELLAAIPAYRLTWILLVDKDRNFTAFAAAGADRQIIKDLAEKSARGEYLQCAREILTQKRPFAACDDVEKYHKGCPLVSYHTEGAGFTGRLEYDGRIYGAISVDVLREAITEDEEQLFFQKLAGDISRALAAIEREELGITERKAAEEAIRESELKYRTLVESSIAGVYIIQDNLFRFVNKRFCEIHGYSYEEVVDKLSPMDLAVVDDREIIAENVRKRLNGEVGNIHYSVRTLRRDGELVTVEILGCSINYNGRRAILGTVIDITDRRQAEEALIESERRYRLLAETLTDVIWTADLDLRFTYISPSIELLRGVSVDEAMGQTLEEILTPASLEIAMKALAEEMEIENLPVQDLSRVKTMELEMNRRDGSTVWTESKINFLRDPEGRIREFLGVTRDITERREAEKKMNGLRDQLRQSQKLEAIGSLAGGIAHDFNNLLTVISGYGQLALSGLKQRDPLMDNLKEIIRASDRATDLTRQLLAFSRRQVMELKALDVNKLILGMEKMLQRMIGEDIRLRIQPAEELGMTKADPGQIEQVILNLAVNSRDAMPLGGRLILETDNVYINEEYAGSHVGVKPGHYVRLSVSDTGHGIPTEDRDRIFDPFFTTKAKGKGTGLGLATVYGIVKQSGGNIWVYSEQDKGTTFKIYLPRADEPFEEIKGKRAENGTAYGTETILVVEDEEIVRKLAVHMLGIRGYKLLEAANSGEALLICEQHKEPIQLILTDVVMPRMSGPEFIRRLRQTRKDFKVLFMSGYTDEAVLLHGVQEGEIDFIQKPFTL
ncbi:MAG: PAS domain S-box protein [Spirochaetes bacterium]|nr:PAS domain S-box protein [Spirochaetota bacterium]